MEKYTHIGMLFEKKRVNEHNILNPINTVRCNIVDELTYNVEFIGELGSVFEYAFDTDDVSVGFVISLEELKKKYGDEENFINIYQDEILSNLYIQTNDYNSDIITTYKLNLYTNKFYKICEFKDNAINEIDEEITFSNDDILESLSIDNKSKIIDKTKENKVKNEDINIDINMIELYNSIIENVIGQDKAVKQIVSTIDRNYNIENFRNKTNILLIGPSGSGKTEIFRTIEELIKVPITIEDSEQYSAVGYYGSSIEDMLVKLYHKANGNLKLAEKGILVIDEIDKKITDNKDDVSGTRVLNSLLALMEGTTFRINTTGNDYNPNYVNFDTSYLTVILAGAFSFMITTDKNIGFNKELEHKQTYDQIDIEKLNKYGLSNELLRRVSIYKLKELSVEDLINIMKISKNSYLKELYKYAEKKKIRLEINDDAIRKIAEISKKKGTGASGIKATLNEILNDAFFEINLKKKSFNTIEVTAESLEKVPPYILRKKRNTKKN